MTLNSGTATLSIVTQPEKSDHYRWMQSSLTATPTGLENLASVDRLTCQEVYYAFEESACSLKYCCGFQKRYVIHLANEKSQRIVILKEVIRVERPYKFWANSIGCCACCKACAQSINIFLTNGTLIGNRFLKILTNNCFISKKWNFRYDRSPVEKLAISEVGKWNVSADARPQKIHTSLSVSLIGYN
uniref:Phospholipid scramblase n=1 Tax=Syphacia muris TaxID=451379 RepID=A0A0N5AU42_9BILA